MSDNKSESSESWISIKVEREGTGEILEYDISEEDLQPMVSDDRLRRAIEELERTHERDRWGEEYQDVAKSREEYIDEVKDDPIPYFRRILCWPKKPSPNQLAFRNTGGIFDQGICWWHSRFQRNMACLCYLNPSGEPPSLDEARELVWQIMQARKVFEITGFKSLREFTATYHKEIQNYLENLQIIEGGLFFGWINGLAGKSKVPASEMQALMDAIYDEVTNKGVAYVKLQVPGWDSHAWLISEMEIIDTDSNGNHEYRYKFLDSNSLNGPWTWHHSPGEEHIQILGTSFGAPYLQRKWELRKIKRAINRFVDDYS